MTDTPKTDPLFQVDVNVCGTWQVFEPGLDAEMAEELANFLRLGQPAPHCVRVTLQKETP
jgi:hypothetical protein